MLKTYLYIPESLQQQIVQTAKRQKTSRAAVMRRALQEGIDVVNRQTSGGADVLLKIAELGKRYHVKGPRNAVARFDDYLYGRDWSRDG